MSMRTTHLLTSASVLSGLFLLLAACDGSGGSEGGGGTCAQYVNTLVAYIDRCGDGVSTVRGDARARLEAACVRGLAAPGAAPNADAQVASCTQKISAASCDAPGEFDCELTGGTLDDGAPCGENYQCKSGACKTEPGTSCGKCTAKVAVGGACTSSSQCVDGAECNFTSSEGGTCRAVKIAKAGEMCGSTDGEVINCEPGLNCSFESGGATCKARGPAGADCTSRLDCLSDLTCVAGKCAAGLAEGAACSFGECGKGLDCSKDKKCARVVFVKAGEECDSTRRCERGSCNGSSTGLGPEGQLEVTPGKCVDPLPDGAACNKDQEDGPRCDAFAECTNGKCTVVDPAQCK